MQIVGPDALPVYWKTCQALFMAPFEAHVFRDDNRVADGLAMRDAYYRETGYKVCPDNYMETCSVLELMVALAQRMEYTDLHDPDLGDRTPEWFWVMFNSLGLDIFTDNYFDEEAVQDIINDFIERRYDRQGHGSLFTVRNRRVDMRTTEIWYQAQYWMSENT